MQSRHLSVGRNDLTFDNQPARLSEQMSDPITEM
jgi:hypothetical protein